MPFTAYLGLGHLDAEADKFSEIDGDGYARQVVSVDARNAGGFVAFGGKLTAATIVNGSHATGRSAIIFGAAHDADAQALYADPTGGEPLAWWPAKADAADPYTREGGDIGLAPSGPGFELVLERFTGAPTPRAPKAA